MVFHDRRTFLKCAGFAAVGAGVGGCLTRSDGGDSEIVKVHITHGEVPLLQRTFAILQSRVEERCPAKVVESKHGADIVLDIDASIPEEGFRIDEVSRQVRISGGSPRGVLYGVGKFLRTSRYKGGFKPSSWRGTSVPQGSLRGMYFASHFHNWYCQASDQEINRYLEDLSLWGINAVMIIFPMINLKGWDDPEAAPALEMMRKYARAAKTLELQVTTGINNALFTGIPDSIRATRLPDPTKRRGNSGHPICPSNPDGHTYIMENTALLFERLSDIGLDILCFWPYDEGGCACEKCLPWGSNGYLRLSRDQAALARRYFPKLKTVLSTWMFDTPPEGEWQGLADNLAKENGWLDYILADSHEDFPRYPLENGVPGKLPLINFPEISMWANWPWGGVGAHPLPARFQRLWDQVKHVVAGGFPYSEGIYEDMTKAIVVQFYWNREQTARATLAEYISYEYSPEVVADVFAIVDVLEASASAMMRKEPVDVLAVRRACDLAESVHERLPEWAKKSWRWEILRLRAKLDRERFAGEGLDTTVAQTAMARLAEIYHCEIETDDPYHHRVRPRLKNAVSRKGQL